MSRRIDGEDLSEDSGSSPPEPPTPRHNDPHKPLKPILKNAHPPSADPGHDTTHHSRTSSRVRYHSRNPDPGGHDYHQWEASIPPPPMGSHAPRPGEKSTYDTGPSLYGYSRVQPGQHREPRSNPPREYYSQGEYQLGNRGFADPAEASSAPYPFHVRRSSRPVVPAIQIPVSEHDSYPRYERPPPASPAHLSEGFYGTGSRAPTFRNDDGTSSQVDSYRHGVSQPPFLSAHRANFKRSSPRPSPRVSPGHSPHLQPREYRELADHWSPTNFSDPPRSVPMSMSTLHPEDAYLREQGRPQGPRASSAGYSPPPDDSYRLSPESPFNPRYPGLYRSDSERASSASISLPRRSRRSDVGSDQPRSTRVSETVINVQTPLSPRALALLNAEGITIERTPDGNSQTVIDLDKVGRSRSGSGSGGTAEDEFGRRFGTPPSRRQAYERDPEQIAKGPDRARAASTHTSTLGRRREPPLERHPPDPSAASLDWSSVDLGVHHLPATAHLYSATAPSSPSGGSLRYGSPRYLSRHRTRLDLDPPVGENVDNDFGYGPLESPVPSLNLDTSAQIIPPDQASWQAPSSQVPSDYFDLRRGSVNSMTAQVGVDHEDYTRFGEQDYAEGYDPATGPSWAPSSDPHHAFYTGYGSEELAQRQRRTDHPVESSKSRRAIWREPPKGSWAAAELEERQAALKHSPPLETTGDSSGNTRSRRRPESSAGRPQSRPASWRLSEGDTGVPGYYQGATGPWGEETTIVYDDGTMVNTVEHRRCTPARDSSRR